MLADTRYNVIQTRSKIHHMQTCTRIRFLSSTIQATCLRLLTAMVSFRRYYVHIVVKNVQIATRVKRLRVGLPRVWKTCIRGKMRVVLHGQWTGATKGAHRDGKHPGRYGSQAAEYWSALHVDLHQGKDASRATRRMGRSHKQAILPSAACSTL